jgi:hypothetical protein
VIVEFTKRGYSILIVAHQRLTTVGPLEIQILRSDPAIFFGSCAADWKRVLIIECEARPRCANSRRGRNGREDPKERLRPIGWEVLVGVNGG